MTNSAKSNATQLIHLIQIQVFSAKQCYDKCVQGKSKAISNLTIFVSLGTTYNINSIHNLVYYFLLIIRVCSGLGVGFKDSLGITDRLPERIIFVSPLLNYRIRQSIQIYGIPIGEMKSVNTSRYYEKIRKHCQHIYSVRKTSIYRRMDLPKFLPTFLAQLNEHKNHMNSEPFVGDSCCMLTTTEKCRQFLSGTQNIQMQNLN